jgi:hypothetical protein
MRWDMFRGDVRGRSVAVEEKNSTMRVWIVSIRHEFERWVKQLTLMA